MKSMYVVSALCLVLALVCVVCENYFGTGLGLFGCIGAYQLAD